MSALITKEQRFLQLANGRESFQTADFDPAPLVKLFTPGAGSTWLLTEIDPNDHDHAFGLCDLGLGMSELCWVSLQELATVRGELDLPIPTHLSFKSSGLNNWFSSQFSEGRSAQLDAKRMLN